MTCKICNYQGKGKTTWIKWKDGECQSYYNNKLKSDFVRCPKCDTVQKREDFGTDTEEHY